MIKINLLRDPFIHSAVRGGAAKNGAAKNGAADNPGEAKMDMMTDTNGNGGRQTPVASIASCLFFCCLGGLYFFWLNSEAASEQNRNALLLEQKEELRPYLEKEERSREKSESLRKREEVLTRLKKQQQLPVYFLQELANSLPENVWFAKITSKGPKVEIRGESLTEDAIYQFRDNLATKGQWFSNVNFLGASRRDKRLEFTLTFELVQA